MHKLLFVSFFFFLSGSWGNSDSRFLESRPTSAPESTSEEVERHNITAIGTNRITGNVGSPVVEAINVSKDSRQIIVLRPNDLSSHPSEASHFGVSHETNDSIDENFLNLVDGDIVSNSGIPDGEMRLIGVEGINRQANEIVTLPNLDGRFQDSDADNGEINNFNEVPNEVGDRRFPKDANVSSVTVSERENDGTGLVLLKAAGICGGAGFVVICGKQLLKRLYEPADYRTAWRKAYAQPPSTNHSAKPSIIPTILGRQTRDIEYQPL